jgi:putative ABC transport system permease protein
MGDYDEFDDLEELLSDIMYMTFDSNLYTFDPDLLMYGVTMIAV